MPFPDDGDRSEEPVIFLVGGFQSDDVGGGLVGDDLVGRYVDELDVFWHDDVRSDFGVYQ